MTRIIPIEAAQRGLTRKKRPPGAPYCGHNGLVLVDEHARLLECKRCGATLDPFEYLLKIAGDNDRAWAMAKRYEEKAQELADKVDELKRTERNTKARLRRARRKMEDLHEQE